MIQQSTAVLGIIVGLLLVLYWWERRQPDVPAEAVADAVETSIDTTGLRENLDELESTARNVEGMHDDLESLLRSPHERGTFGEISLQLVLSNHLSGDVFSVNNESSDIGERPASAEIQSASGTICVDSRFPLENYRLMIESEGSAEEQYQEAFYNNVETHLQAVADNYVRPEEGTAEVAFAYVPSETVYYHLVTNNRELLDKYSGYGVQVVSPLTLAQSLELIMSDIQTRKLSEEARQIRLELEELTKSLQAFENEWNQMKSYVRDSHSKLADVETEYQQLRDRFESARDTSDEDE